MTPSAIKRKLSEQVLERLEEMIRDETFPVGSSLPAERDLMEMFGVGRPSIREALFALERMGLVRIQVGERAKVTRPTPDHLMAELGGVARLLLEEPQGVAHFEQARVFLEESLARHAAANASQAQIAALRASLEANERAIGRARRFAETDVAFHRVLAQIPGNPIFVALHDALVRWLLDQRPTPADPETDNRSSFEGHVRILEAIEARRPERAGEAMREHLEAAFRRYRGD